MKLYEMTKEERDKWFSIRKEKENILCEVKMRDDGKDCVFCKYNLMPSVSWTKNFIMDRKINWKWDERFDFCKNPKRDKYRKIIPTPKERTCEYFKKTPKGAIIIWGRKNNGGCLK